MANQGRYLRTQIGFQEGDNILEVTNKTAKVGGEVETKIGGTGYALPSSKPIIHESGHFIGLDERYSYDEKTGKSTDHTYFDTDIMSHGVADNMVQMHSQHFVDILNFALKNTNGDTPDRNPIIIGNKSNDNTNTGSNPTKNPVVNEPGVIQQ